MIERHGEAFLSRSYTVREIGYCQGKKHATEHFAGHWAAKQAVLRSLGDGWRGGLFWTDIEVRRDARGAPTVFLCGQAKERALELKIADILLTVAQCRTHATAYAIVLGRDL
jgi:holo-[acyl-carrier protein] synthase